KLTPDPPAKRRIDGLMLLDAAHSFKAAADDARSIMISIPCQIADDHLGIRDGRLDEPFDLAGGHRHQRFDASMICRLASISLLRIASSTCSSSQSMPAAV